MLARSIRYHGALTNTVAENKCSEPIVICPLGFMYNKEAAVRALIDKTMPSKQSHIRSLKVRGDMYTNTACIHCNDAGRTRCPTCRTSLT